MKRRRWTSEIEIGDPSGELAEEVGERVPALGEAGPSNWRARRVEFVEDSAGDAAVLEEGVVWLEEDLDTAEGTSGGHARRSPPPLASLPLFLLPFLPLASAAPPRQRRPPPPPPPFVTPPPGRIRRHAVPFFMADEFPDVDTNPALPTSTTILPETALPYVLSQLGDGSWTKVDNGWSVFGRQAGPTDPVLADTDPAATSDPQSLSWAIEQSLPTGWGQTSNRTDIYKVSLISVAAVIMAFGIVVGIMIIVINRRKAHRRAKRRAERLRRKQLAAAGLNEDDINGNTANAAFEQKLEELEKQHRSPKAAKKSGPGSIVRVKVRAWRSGLRRRKGKKEDEDVVEVVEVAKPVESPTSDRSRPSVDSDSSRHGSTTDERPSTGNTDTSDQSPATTQTSNNSSDRSSGDATAGANASGHYFPPAYRPASVRSIPLGGPSSSSSSPPPPHPAEKTRAPGYYPAPVNEESEAAIAIASRSDGKAPIREEDREEQREHVRHIATDDKGELERLRLAASAPDGPGEINDGPSAPSVDVDDQGFERVSEEAAESPRMPAGFGGGGLLPAPPLPPLRLRSATRHHFDDDHDGVERGVDETLGELYLTPSAPPTSSTSYFDSPSAPSAPPMAHEHDDSELSTVPSAPPFVLEDDDEAGAPGSGDATGASTRRDSTRSRASSLHDTEAPPDVRTTPGPVFLPKYEP